MNGTLRDTTTSVAYASLANVMQLGLFEPRLFILVMLGCSLTALVVFGTRLGQTGRREPVAAMGQGYRVLTLAFMIVDNNRHEAI